MRTTCRLRLGKHLGRQSGDGHNSSNYELQRLAIRPFLRPHKRKDCHQSARSLARMPCDWQLLVRCQGTLEQRDDCRWYCSHRYCYCCICVRKPRKGQLPQKQRQQEQPEQPKPALTSVASY
jgi:hypothetical protein